MRTLAICLVLVGCNDARRHGGPTGGGGSGDGGNPDGVQCTAKCDGNRVVTCDGSTVIQDCGPTLSCGDDPASGTAACVTACDPKALAHSYTGCVFYAVDLPQFTIPTPLSGVIAADQQFAVAVANPWDVGLNVTVERDDGMPGMPAQLVTVTQQPVPPKGLVTIPLPAREVSGYVKGVRNRSLLTAQAYRVTTDRPASVYQFNPINNPDAFSNDASLLIPSNALDASYVVLGWPGTGGDVSFAGQTIQTDKRSFLTIVATRNNTKVRVTPTTEVMAGDNVTAIHKGTPYVLTLNEFETLNLEGADFTTAGATDFSGTRIEADGPLAVWSGVECITINPNPPADPNKTCCCDHLEEQLFPRSSLAGDYVVVRSEGRGHQTPDPEFFRVMALTDGTTVQTTLAAPNDSFTLNAGEMREVMAEDDFTLHASKAVTIGQFQVSQDSSEAETGDPSFSLVPPVAQHRKEYIFLIPSGYMENWVLMAVPANLMPVLDGQVLTNGCERQPTGSIGGVAYEALRCPVSEGAHLIEGPQPFGLVIEGWGPGPVSYGYTGGMDFQTVNNDCTNDGNCPTGEFCAGGECAPTIM
jgi:hypothetical protein